MHSGSGSIIMSGETEERIKKWAINRKRVEAKGKLQCRSGRSYIESFHFSARLNAAAASSSPHSPCCCLLHLCPRFLCLLELV